MSQYPKVFDIQIEALWNFSPAPAIKNSHVCCPWFIFFKLKSPLYPVESVYRVHLHYLFILQNGIALQKPSLDGFLLSMTGIEFVAQFWAPGTGTHSDHSHSGH